MFLFRVKLIALTTLSVLTGAQAASAQSIEDVVKSELGHTFGLLGPMPLNAADVVSQGNQVSLIDATYGDIPVGPVVLQLDSLGDSIFAVQSLQMPLSHEDGDGSSVQATDWSFNGEWNEAIQGYQSLDYRANDLVIKTKEGTTYAAKEVVMTADENGYSLRLNDVSGIGGQKPEKTGDPDTTFLLFVSNILYEGRWTGNAAGAPYASLGRSFDMRFLDSRQDGGEALVSSTLGHLENLYLPASSSFTDLQISDLSLVMGQYDLEIELKNFSLPAASQGDELKEQMVNIRLDGLDIRRREDFAGMKKATLSVDLSGADVEGFSKALASLFVEAEPGANWSVLADTLLFFDSVGIEGTAEDLVFALPDRLFALSMDQAKGALGLTDMRLDGGFITLRGEGDGIELQAMDTPEGVEPDPIVVPSIVPVLGGRLIRFDPLSQSLVPSEFQTTIEVTGLPMANLRQTLESLPRAGSVQDPRGMLRSLVGGALGMVTPFLIQPPRVSVSDTVAKADDYTMTLTGEHQVMPIPPLFGFGEFTGIVKGLEAVEARANATTEAALAGEGEEAKDLADYGRRIAGWAKRLKDLGTASSADEQTYVLELTQFGEIELNGEPFNQR